MANIVWERIRDELNQNAGDKLYDHRWRLLSEALLDLKANPVRGDVPERK